MKNFYLMSNCLLCVTLSGLAMYSPKATGTDLPGWEIPLVYMALILIFAGKSFRSPKNALMNIGLMVIAGILILGNLPPQITHAIKWWYPLVIGLVANFFIRLD